MKSYLITLSILFSYFCGLSQIETITEDLRINPGTKVFFSIPPIIDLEGLMIQAGVEYPINEKLALKHVAAYYLYTDDQGEPGKLDGFRLGTTMKVYFQKANYWSYTYIGVTTLWKRAEFEGIRFLPQENSVVWKKAEFSNIYNILGFYGNIGFAKKSGNHFFSDIGLMMGPEYVHIKWVDVPDGTSNIPNIPQPDLFYLIDGPGGGWRFMVRLVADIGYSF